MSCWQSFLVAWVIAQLIPALAESPTGQNFFSAGMFVATLILAFAGVNAICRWCREIFSGARAADDPLPALAGDPDLRPRVAVTVTAAQDQPIEGLDRLLGKGRGELPSVVGSTQGVSGSPPRP